MIFNFDFDFATGVESISGSLRAARDDTPTPVPRILNLRPRPTRILPLDKCASMLVTAEKTRSWA